MEQTVFRKYEERNFTVTKYDLYIDPKRTEIRCSPDGVIYLLTYLLVVFSPFSTHSGLLFKTYN